MENYLTIEVEVRDHISQQLFTIQSDPFEISMINGLKNRLEEKLGGMLCINHFHLPTCTSAYIRGRWVVCIAGCCSEQIKHIEHRLQELYDDII